MQDGIAVPGATATATAAAIGNTVILPIPAIVRVIGCACSAESVLTLMVTGEAVTNVNTAISVSKL